jgi:hypothetical protein
VGKRERAGGWMDVLAALRDDVGGRHLEVARVQGELEIEGGRGQLWNFELDPKTLTKSNFPSLVLLSSSLLSSHRLSIFVFFLLSIPFDLVYCFGLAPGVFLGYLVSTLSSPHSLSPHLHTRTT